MKSSITLNKLNSYISLTKKAVIKAKKSKCRRGFEEERKEFLLMIESYISDSGYFLSRQDFVNSFAAINYAHGWLDAGARLGIFQVKDSKLFAVDD